MLSTATLERLVLCYILNLLSSVAEVHQSTPVQLQHGTGPVTSSRHQFLKQLRIDVIRKQVMHKLRLPNQFAVNASKDIPRVVFRKALEKLRMRDEDFERTGMVADAYAQISEIVSFSETDMGSPINAIHFTLSDDVIDPILVVSEAQIWVLLKYKRGITKEPRTVTLLVKELRDGKDVTEKIAEQQSTVWHTRWQKINISPEVVQKLISKEGEKLSLVIECPDCDETLSPVLARKVRQGTRPRQHIRLNKRRPFLIINTRVNTELLPTPGPEERFKRTVNNAGGALSNGRFVKRSSNWQSDDLYDRQCNFTADNRKCRLVTFYVNLRELFGDLVTHPTGTFLNYCAGNCAHVPDDRKCCVATSTAPLRMTYLYPGDETESLSTGTTVVDDLIIRKCGCK